LTIYDMLKGIDESMEIGAVRLLKKTGGKSDWRGALPSPVRAAVLTLSDSVMHGQRQDVSGELLVKALRGYGVEVVAQDLLGDDVEPIAGQLKYYADELKLDLVLTTGGTGLGPRDNTPEAMTRVLQREAPGIVEAARNYGQARMPYAMLSRGKAGLRGKTLIVNLPGSKGGVIESLQALMPHLLHALNMIAGGGHEDKR
jgi:molybdenum cofactor synthesis domain-containing protein